MNTMHTKKIMVVLAKAYDKTGLELGRARLDIKAKAGEAGYYDFIFDKRSYIEVKSRITFE